MNDVFDVCPVTSAAIGSLAAQRAVFRRISGEDPEVLWSARLDVTAESIAKALGGRKAGTGWTARCPAHDEQTPSLSLRNSDDGKVLVRCHAGCGQDEVIARLKSIGLWTQHSRRPFRYPASRSVAKWTEVDLHKNNRTEARCRYGRPHTRQLSRW